MANAIISGQIISEDEITQNKKHLPKIGWCVNTVTCSELGKGSWQLPLKHPVGRSSDVADYPAKCLKGWWNTTPHNDSFAVIKILWKKQLKGESLFGLWFQKDTVHHGRKAPVALTAGAGGRERHRKSVKLYLLKAHPQQRTFSSKVPHLESSINFLNRTVNQGPNRQLHEGQGLLRPL